MTYDYMLKALRIKFGKRNRQISTKIVSVLLNIAIDVKKHSEISDKNGEKQSESNI